MRALTIRQPWATLIARGAKTIETRSWSTKYRGPLAIHAGQSPKTWRELDAPSLMADRVVVDAVLDELGVKDIDGSWPSPYETEAGIFVDWSLDRPTFPLGAVVAVAELVDVVPMEDLDAPHDLVETLDHGRVIYVRPDLDPDFALDTRRHEVPVVDRDVSDEVLFGDFRPGRWGWLLENVEPLEPPVPAKGRQGLWTVDHELAFELELAR